MQPTASMHEVGPPPESGIIMRDGVPTALTWVDAEAGLRVIVGTDMHEFCAGIVNFDIVEYQDAYLRDGRLVELGQGVVHTTVWNFLEFDCALFTTVDPVAQGRSKFVAVDNDLFGIEEGDSNTNSWGFMAHGRLVSSDGERMQFSGHLRQVYSPDDRYTLHSQIILK
jgi:hypothetical protein